MKYNTLLNTSRSEYWLVFVQLAILKINNPLSNFANFCQTRRSKHHNISRYLCCVSIDTLFVHPILGRTCQFSLHVSHNKYFKIWGAQQNEVNCMKTAQFSSIITHYSFTCIFLQIHCQTFITKANTI